MSTRYQGAIVRDHQLLLLQQAQRSTGQRYWLLPGGRAEPGETEEQCVQREMLEETGLRVEVGALLLDEQITWGTITRRKTYLCSAPSGVPRPGYEPESAYASDFEFTAVQGIDLRSPKRLVSRDRFGARQVCNAAAYSSRAGVRVIRGHFM